MPALSQNALYGDAEVTSSSFLKEGVECDKIKSNSGEF